VQKFRAPKARANFANHSPNIAGCAVLAISARTNSPIIASGVVFAEAALMRSQSAERLSTKTTCPHARHKEKQKLRDEGAKIFWARGIACLFMETSISLCRGRRQ